MRLNTKELVIVAATNQGNCGITIKKFDAHFWQAELHVYTQEEPYEIYTQRGEVKTWRNLADVITFLQKNCPKCGSVKIHINDWIFSRDLTGSPTRKK